MPGRENVGFEEINVFGKTLPQLQELCSELDFPRYTARQLCDWLYAKRVDSFDQMLNISLKNREKLKSVAVIHHALPVTAQQSVDGTRKYLFDPYENSQAVEAVFIPDADRATLCVSCQRGCKMGCRFCVTGMQGFHGHLSAGEILSQVLCIPETERLTNIVFMGMGEPMDNYDAVMSAIDVMTADWGLGWSPHRITVSSVGITPMLRCFLDESRCHLAISLHSPFDEERLRLMPMQKAYPIAATLELLRRYDWRGQRRISFEYIMFDGVNDTMRHADALVRLLHNLPCRINLIRFHSAPGIPFQTSPSDTINRFRDYLNNHGITCTLRASRGEDIMAACGLLSGNYNPDNGRIQ